MNTLPAGLIAILRGLTPAEAPSVGDTLYDAGFRRLEVPLNSPVPFESLRALTERLPSDAIIGAGTVVQIEDVDRVHDAGGRLVVAPNTDPAIIERTLELGMDAAPGVATATDVFAALHAGARMLKIFPAPLVGIGGMKAWMATVPEETQFLPVGGIDTTTLPDWLAAGASGAGVGTTLYTPGRTVDDVHRTADALQAIWGRHQEPEMYA